MTHHIHYALFDVSDIVVVVLAPEMASLFATSSVLKIFDSLNFPPENLFIVLNRTFVGRGLARQDIEDAQAEIAALVPVG